MGYFLEKLAAGSLSWEQLHPGQTRPKGVPTRGGNAEVPAPAPKQEMRSAPAGRKTHLKDADVNAGRNKITPGKFDAGAMLAGPDEGLIGRTRRRIGNAARSGWGKVTGSKAGQWIAKNPKKTIAGGAAGTLALGAILGRNKIKKALGYDEGEE